MARKRVLEVFNDMIHGTTAVYTAAEFNDVLGMYDKFSIQAVADQVAGTSVTLTVQYEHTSDLRNWSNKNAGAEISAVSLTTGTTQSFNGYETGANPSHGFGRLRIQLAGTSPAAHVRIFLCQRDEA